MPVFLPEKSMMGKENNAGSTDFELLDRALRCWNGLASFREERERCKRFTYGDQWQDMIEEGGVRMREEEFIRSQGNMPLKNNLIRRLVRNVVGVFRNRWTLPKCVARDPEEQSLAATVNCLLEYNMNVNRLEELYARTMEEFLISGMAVHKKWYGRKEGRADCWTDLVSPANFFFDLSSRDFRGSDITLLGEVHEMRADDIVAAFARDVRDIPVISETLGHRFDSFPSISGQNEKYRILEIWERKKTPRLRCHDLRSGRICMEDAFVSDSVPSCRPNHIISHLVIEEQWHYAFLTMEGRVLARGVSPYPHGRHPYVFKAYPFIDGEIHSFVGDIIDQQKLTNRLISMYDWILRASAKGVLLFPEGSLPDGVDINDIAEEWSRFNGVIVYRPRAGVALPQQISSNSTDIGITGLLEIQMRMMEDISGVNGALQGKLDNGSMSGTLYDQQTRNSLTSLVDLLKSFEDFIRKAEETDVSNIRRFYSERKIAGITGRRPGFVTDLSDSSSFHDTVSDFSIE